MRIRTWLARNLAIFALVVLPLFWIVVLFSYPGFAAEVGARGPAGAIRLVAINVWLYGVQSLPWALGAALLHSVVLLLLGQRLPVRLLSALSVVSALILLVVPFGWPGFREENLLWMPAAAVLLAAYGRLISPIGVRARPFAPGG